MGIDSNHRILTSLKGVEGGGVGWCWVNFQCRGVLLIWIIVIIVEQGLCGCSRCGGGGGGCSDIFSL